MVTNSTSMSAVDALKRILSQSETRHLISIKDVDKNEYYLRFLRVKNMETIPAGLLFERYHEMRLKNKDEFCKMTPLKLKHVLDTGLVTILPGTDNQGRAIMLFRYKLWNTKEISVDEVHLACILLFEEVSSIREFQEKGLVVIHDYDGFEFSHFRQATLNNFMRVIQLMQGSFPLKFKAFHQINQPYLFQILYKLFYPLVSVKLRERVFLYGTETERLADQIPLSSLPLYLGGTVDGCSDKAFMNALFQKERYYETLALSLNNN